MKQPKDSLWLGWSIALGILGTVFVLPFTPFVTVHSWKIYILTAPTVFLCGLIAYGLAHLRYTMHGSKFRVLYYNVDGSLDVASVNHFHEVRITRSSSDTWYWSLRGDSRPVNVQIHDVHPSVSARMVIGVYNVWTLGGVNAMLQTTSWIIRKEKSRISAVS